MSELKPKILIVEDEVAIASSLKLNLELDGFEVLCLADGVRLQNHIENWKPNLLILDVMLPYINGNDLCEDSKIANPQLPIIMLSALGTGQDKVKGLKAGADDYIGKPFEYEELLLRAKKLIGSRIAPPELKAEVESHELAGCKILVKENRIVDRAGKSHELTKKEWELLLLFIDHKNEVISRNDIIAQLWRPDENASFRTIDNLVLVLRKIVDRPDEETIIKSIRGIGYKLVA